ncbi:MAG: serine/threonine protein phosphatase [Clostridiales bacterium]|jgi:predicted phosphohydrolase|nr:serine/threonine protein phosphatase [Clostridiales bacterium]
MALYAIGDLHLSISTNKPMDIFGSVWENHTEKLKDSFSALSSDDVTVICGDLSWGMNLDEAKEDFLFIDNLPGRKIILKGNHDYWWSTASKAKSFFRESGITTIDILNNNCFFYGCDAAICGTRGWFYEEEKGTEHDKKILNRELGRLETSLKAAGDRKKYVFLHYPPKYGTYVCEEILDLFEKYGVIMCCAGHIHGKGLHSRFEGEFRGVTHRLVSADYLNFVPIKILD